MVLKTRGLGTGTTFMRGSYVAEPRLLAWLRGRTVLVKSEHELHRCTTGSEYTEHIYIHLKLIFAFAAQSSLSKVRNDIFKKSPMLGLNLAGFYVSDTCCDLVYPSIIIITVITLYPSIIIITVL